MFLVIDTGRRGVTRFWTLVTDSPNRVSASTTLIAKREQGARYYWIFPLCHPDPTGRSGSYAAHEGTALPLASGRAAANDDRTRLGSSISVAAELDQPGCMGNSQARPRRGGFPASYAHVGGRPAICGCTAVAEAVRYVGALAHPDSFVHQPGHGLDTLPTAGGEPGTARLAWEQYRGQNRDQAVTMDRCCRTC